MKEIFVKIPRYNVEMVDLKNCIRHRYHIESKQPSEETCKNCFFFGGDVGSTYYSCRYQEYITEATHGKLEEDRTYYWKQFICFNCGEFIKGDVSSYISSYYFSYKDEFKCKHCGAPHVYIQDECSEFNSLNKEWIVKFVVPVNGGWKNER